MTEAINAVSYMSFLERRAYATIHHLVVESRDEHCLGATTSENEVYAGKQKEQYQPRSPLHVSRAHVRWLGLKAFQVVLRRKKTTYKATLLLWIDCELQFSQTSQASLVLCLIRGGTPS
jgi:hypothetical protein